MGVGLPGIGLGYGMQFGVNDAGLPHKQLISDLPGNCSPKVMREQMRELPALPPGNPRQCLTFGGERGIRTLDTVFDHIRP